MRGFAALAARLAAALALVSSGCADASPDRVGPTPGRPRFDGARALELVERQVAFGPRVPGTEGHARQLDWMLAHLDSLVPEVQADTFTHRTAAGEDLELTNVVARFRPEEARRVLLLAHWDTRPRSDQAADSARRSLPVPGANDGASGVAVLLELARLFAGDPPPLGVDVLLVDGEDYGPANEDMFLGARRYAASLAGTEPGAGRAIYGVLIDMVGDADPLFPMEGHSVDMADPVVRKLWRVAARLGYPHVFVDRVGRRLYDDHVPLNDAGLPTADVIDFDYGPDNRYWHTPEDTPDKLSGATLEIVGETLAELIYSGG